MSKRADRAEARDQWARVADGDLDNSTTREWVITVAKRLLEADDLQDREGNARRSAIQRAVGLYGSKRRTAEEREIIRNLAELLALENHLPRVTEDFIERITGSAEELERSDFTPLELQPPRPRDDWVPMLTPLELRAALREMIVIEFGLPYEDLSTPEGKDRLDSRIRTAFKDGR